MPPPPNNFTQPPVAGSGSGDGFVRPPADLAETSTHLAEIARRTKTISLCFLILTIINGIIFMGVAVSFILALIFA